MQTEAPGRYCRFRILLTRDETYLLCLTVDTGERDVYYYTRIMWAEHGSYAEDMVDLADTFTRKSLDYEQAQDLTAYLETSSTEDNSSLGYVTIRASFNHFTWTDWMWSWRGEPQITLQEYDGLMGQVQVKYKVRVREKSGAESLVLAEDNFTMKWNEQRIYMMNYERCARGTVYRGSCGFFKVTDPSGNPEGGCGDGCEKPEDASLHLQ